jgi:hypothetical protein
MTCSSGRPCRSRNARAAFAPVDLEALVLGAVALKQTNVVEHRADVEELGVVVEAELLGLQRSPEEHSTRMVEQQPRGGVPQELGRLTGKAAVGDRNPRDRSHTTTANTTFPRRPGSMLRANASRADASG